MTIVHIDTGLTLRGGQRQLLRLTRGLADRGHVQIIVCPEGSDLEGRAAKEGYRVFPLPARDLGHANGICQLRQRLLSEPAQILHAHDGRGQTVSWLASWGLKVRRVASRRVTFLPRTRVRYRFIYTRTCHAVIAVSKFVRGLLIESGVPAPRIEVIPDGIEVPASLPSPGQRARARAEWGIGSNDFVVGQLGASTPEKGQETSAGMMSSLVDRLPRARLLFMGDASPENREKLLRVAGSGANRLQFLDSCEDLAPYFAAIDLLVMPSRMEGLGSAALLAMAHGRAVVASRVGGLPEVVEDGVTGWLVSPDSARGIDDVIFSAASNAPELARMGITARERAFQFSADIMVARTEKLYSQLA